MKRFLLSSVFILLSSFALPSGEAKPVGDVKAVEINPEEEVHHYSIAEHAIILEDPNQELKLSDVQKKSTGEFKELEVPVPNLDFTTSGYWVKFKVKNNTAHFKEFLLEVARPLTNKADLYTIHPNGLILKKQHGDELPFDNREVEHRRLVFPVSIEAKKEYTYYLNLASDGEVIMLPIKLWNPTAFSEQNYKEQYILGFYYGVLLFVIIIYFFFYVALNEKSFLYYVLYVASLFVFQFCLDGLAYQFFWPDQVWFGNHATVLFAALTVFLVVKYAQEFLETKTKMPKWNKVFNGLLVFILLCFIAGFTSGKVYAINFIATNAISFASIIFIIVAILVYRKKHKVNLFFLLAFISVIAGGVVFILGNFGVIKYTMFTEQAIKLGSAVEVIFLSLTMAGKYRDIQQEKEKAQEAVLKKMQEMNKLKDEINEELELQVKERTSELNKRNEELAEKNKDITDSINYAKKIQEAILPANDEFEQMMPDSFVLFKPKDIVSGDFYWVAEKSERIFFTASDCTGHGVPGAFMSVIGATLYNQVVLEKGESEPGEILNKVRLGIIDALKQRGEEGTQRDGMDVAFCVWSPKDNTLHYAGANNPLYIVRPKAASNLEVNGDILEPKNEGGSNKLYEVRADRQPVGKLLGDLTPFTTKSMKLEKGDAAYVFSDGYVDQFGGEEGKKFKSANFKKLLLSIQEKTMGQQKEILDETIMKWMEGYDQIDDICIIGTRIN